MQTACSTDEHLDYLLKRAEERLGEARISTVEDDDAPQSKHTQRLKTSGLPTPYVEANDCVAVAESQSLLNSRHRALARRMRTVTSRDSLQRRKLKAQNATAGSDWYNLPRTELTPELKRDLQLLRMRSVLDTKRFYKKDNANSGPPKFSQIGTIVEGPAEFFSARIAKRDRKRTIAEEVLATEVSNGRLKRQYSEIQKKKTSGKKADYDKRMEKRYGKKVAGR